LKRKPSVRVNGDLIDAIARAREIDQRLTDFRWSGQSRRRSRHAELVQAYLDDLTLRAEAGEVATATVRRYESALDHYLSFMNLPETHAAYSYAHTVDRDFALAFAAYLNTRTLTPNGHPNARRRKMRGQDFVLNVVRTMFEWAADPDRGNEMPAGFRNPFLRRCVRRQRVAADMNGEPDITVDMATRFLQACDGYQLRLFAPIVFYGLRASEPAFLFYEYIEEHWMTMACIEPLDYMTKGRRNKRLPLLDVIRDVLRRPGQPNPSGLVFLRRSVANGDETSPLLGAGVEELAADYQQRCHRRGKIPAAQRLRVRRAVFRDAGAIDYDAIQREFRRITRRLGWPPQATLKDFRHLFSTAMANGGMPEHERRYLMGHAPGKDAIIRYTHLNKLAEHHRKAVEQELGPALEVLRCRIS